MNATKTTTMTSRERVLAATKGLPVDRVPVMYWLNPHMTCRLMAEYRPGGNRVASALARTLWRRYVRGGGLEAGELTRALPLLCEQYGNGPYALELGAHIAIQSPDLTSARSFLGAMRRDNGRLRIRGPLGITYGIGGIYAEVAEHPIKGPDDLRTFELPPVVAQQFAGIAKFRRTHPDVCILGETFAFQQAVADFLMGTTRFMLALYDYPDALQAFMARLADWVIAIMRQTGRAGAAVWGRMPRRWWRGPVSPSYNLAIARWRDASIGLSTTSFDPHTMRPIAGTDHRRRPQ